MSLENTIICRKCGYVRICFDGTTGYNGKLVPKEFRTGLVHRCDISEPFQCVRCDEKLYFDKKILSLAGRRKALDYDTGKYHACKGRSDSIEC